MINKSVMCFIIRIICPLFNIAMLQNLCGNESFPLSHCLCFQVFCIRVMGRIFLSPSSLMLSRASWVSLFSYFLFIWTNFMEFSISRPSEATRCIPNCFLDSVCDIAPPCGTESNNNRKYGRTNVDTLLCLTQGSVEIMHTNTFFLHVGGFVFRLY